MARAGYAFGFPFGWTLIWTFSYLAASSTSIITETSAGADEVSGWPEPDWRQWVGEMCHYIPSLGAAATSAHFITQITSGHAGFYWPVSFAVFFLLAPILVLSVFDSGSAFTMITPFVISSLARRWWAWLRFYATAAALTLLWPGTLMLGYSLAPFHASVITGPLMAAAFLIYARLLGRLAFLVAR